jgi:hypothetical protein
VDRLGDCDQAQAIGVARLFTAAQMENSMPRKQGEPRNVGRQHAGPPTAAEPAFH